MDKSRSNILGSSCLRPCQLCKPITYFTSPRFAFAILLLASTVLCASTFFAASRLAVRFSQRNCLVTFLPALRNLHVTIFCRNSGPLHQMNGTTDLERS